MRFSVLAILAFATLLFASCGKRIKGRGPVTTVTKNLNGFNRVHLSGSPNVELSQGPFSVQVVAQENLIPYIETVVKNGTLTIRQKQNTRLSTNRPMVVRVTLPDISEVELTGSGEIAGKTVLKNSSKLDITLTGSGAMNLEVDAPEIDADITGSGDISLKGQCRRFDGQVSGSGNLSAEQLKAESAKGDVTGSGNLTLFGSREINAHTSGSGNVSYTGGGNVKSSKTGSGSVGPM